MCPLCCDSMTGGIYLVANSPNYRQNATVRSARAPLCVHSARARATTVLAGCRTAGLWSSRCDLSWSLTHNRLGFREEATNVPRLSQAAGTPLYKTTRSKHVNRKAEKRKTCHLRSASPPLSRARRRLQHPKKDKKGKGHIRVEHAEIHRQPTLLEYLAGGLQISMTCAIDFTGEICSYTALLSVQTGSVAFCVGGHLSYHHVDKVRSTLDKEHGRDDRRWGDP